jgi:hypothetical protein
LALAFLVAWTTLVVVLVLFVRAQGRLSLETVGAALALLVVAAYPGRHIFGGVRYVMAKREIVCLEK